MAFKTKQELSSETTIKLGGLNEAGKPNPTKIEGYYIGSRVTKDTGYGPGLLHFFQTPKGNVGVWGKTRLNNLLTAELVGQMCRATFTGMGQKVKGKNPAYMFKVEHDEENTIDVSGIDISAPETQDESYEDDVDMQSEEQPEDQPEEEQEEVEVAPPPAARRPATPAKAPAPAQVNKVQELLAKRGNARAS